MGGASRYDFYRILIPGALAVVLADLVGRVLLLTPNPMIQDQTLDQMKGFVALVEDPFRGAALAFTLGFLAYFLDPGYVTPEYRDRLPSARLGELLREWDRSDVEEKGLYFILLNEHMPDNVRERALLYGAFFRIGVQVILAAYLTATVMPLLILFISTAGVDRGSLGDHLTVTRPGKAVVLFVAVELGLLFLRRITIKRRSAADANEASPAEGGSIPRWARARGWARARADGPGFPALTIVVVGNGGWLVGTAIPSIQAGDGRSLVTTGVLCACVVWTMVRLVGPLGSWFHELWRGTEYIRSDKHYSRTGLFIVDGAFSSVALTGLLIMSGTMTSFQLTTIAGLLSVGILLAFTRKHERQQHGIYRNQRTWMEGNKELILEVAGPPSDNS